MNSPHTYTEIDCPWFSPDWLAEHPDFPVANVTANTTTKE